MTAPTKPTRVPISLPNQICSPGGFGAASPVRVRWNQSTAAPTPAALKCSCGWSTGGLTSMRAVPALMSP
jgi:hypothetical protein